MNSPKQTFSSNMLGTCKFVLLSLLVSCWFINLTMLGVTAQEPIVNTTESTLDMTGLNTTLDTNLNGTGNGTTANPNGATGSFYISQMTLIGFVLCTVLAMNRS